MRWYQAYYHLLIISIWNLGKACWFELSFFFIRIKNLSFLVKIAKSRLWQNCIDTAKTMDLTRICIQIFCNIRDIKTTKQIQSQTKPHVNSKLKVKNVYEVTPCFESLKLIVAKKSCRYMAEIVTIRRKTLSSRSIL